MNGWVIYDAAQWEKNRFFAEQLVRGASRYVPTELIFAERLSFGWEGSAPVFFYEGKRVAAPDFAIVRCIFPLLSETLETAGTRVCNPAAISRVCNDKRLTYAAVAKGGIPILPTRFVCRRFFDPDTVTAFPCVLKSAAGHGGSEVFLVRDRAELTVHLAALPEELLWQAVNTVTGRDLRVYVLGGKPLAAVMRSSDGFRSNFSLGGTATPYSLTAADEGFVARIIAALPVLPDFVGVDLLPTEEGWVLNEIEDVVGCRMLYQTGLCDPAAAYTAYLFGRE